jgi:SAM-dependent methyltransferase
VRSVWQSGRRVPLTMRFGADPNRFFAAAYDAGPPWDIGAPQPALMELFSEFPPAGPALDLGSGSGDLSIWLAGRGLHVLGVDFVPAAVKLAQERAASLSDRVAANLEFRVADALKPASFGRQFGTIADSGFYHLFEADRCERFAVELTSALRPGGRYYLLAFAVDFPSPDVPRGISADELRRHFAASKGWKVLALRDAEFVSRVGPVPAICACFERA